MRANGKALTTVLIILLMLFVAPVLTSLLIQKGLSAAAAKAWWEADNSSAGISPDPATTPEAILQVFSARAFGWRGALGVHTWVAFKPTGAQYYTRMEVIGWGVHRGMPAVRVHRGVPDARWYGEEPRVLIDRRGEGVDKLIRELLEAAETYPHDRIYRVWPGPNSNTFIAYLGRSVPELRMDLPPTAIGKDFIPGGGIVATAPSGTGFQVSLLGLAGVMLALEEGLEVNLLGLTVGVDVWTPALKLPGLGRIGFEQSS
jgi:hypothetical protein